MVDFLRQQILLDLAGAQEVIEAAEDYTVGRDLDERWQWLHSTKPSKRDHGWSTRFFDTDWDPSRVLAECTVKLGILELFEQFRTDELRAALKQIAALYALEPGYRR